MDLLLNDLLPTVLSDIVRSYLSDIEIDGVPYKQEDVSCDMLFYAKKIHFYCTFVLGDGNRFRHVEHISGVPKIVAKSFMALFISSPIRDSPDLALWDVSSVENMYNMFYHAESFNADLSRWDVSNVQNMHNMFYKAYRFNCNLSAWKVPNVRDMWRMFKGAKRFRNGRSFWNIRNIAFSALRRLGFTYAGYPRWLREI